MRRIPGKYVVLAMLAVFLALAVLVGVLVYGMFIFLAGYRPQPPAH